MRWLIVLATFLLSVLLYVDRVCISAAKDAVSADLGLSEKEMGWVFSAFALGYALLQTPSGWLADRMGPRRVLALIVVIWSAFTGLTAVVNSWVSMLVVRFLFGAGEAGAFPGMSRAVYSWMPMQERGIAQGINFSGSRIGAAVALPLVSLLIVQFGWRITFLVLMLVGFAWAAFWIIVFRDEPEDASWLGSAEKEYILSHRQQSTATDTDTPRENVFRTLVRSPTMWALCGQYFASNFIFFFALTWFFPQLRERYELGGIQASLFAAAPLFFGAVGNWVAGFWVDRLFRANQWRWSRRLPAITGFTLATVGIVACSQAESAMGASFWFSLCVFGADMTLSPSWSCCVDIGRQRAGVVSGSMNMAGNVGAFITSLAFPYLLAWTGSSQPFFYVAASLNVMAIGLWWMIDPTRPLEQT